MRIIFFNIGWMRNYNGMKGDSIARGGTNNDDKNHESCNFSTIRNQVYGYVQPTGKSKQVKKRQIRIEKLGAKKTDKSISNITVVWTAAAPDSGGTVVIGWYKNATVYRHSQPLKKRTHLQKDNGLNHYQATTSKENAILLPVEKRIQIIPRGVKGGIGQSNVWYGNKPESKQYVDPVIKLIKGKQIKEIPDIDTSAISAKEGNPRLKTHLIRERNSTLVQQKKEQVLQKTGKLCCEVCGFDFYEKYGDIGEGFCEVHHLTPLSQSDHEVETKIEDLAIICSNCHRIIHRKNPMLSLEKLQNIIKKSNN